MKRTNHKISLGLPEGWQDQSSFVFTGPEVGGVGHLLMVQVEESQRGVSLSDFSRERIAMVEGSTPGIEPLKSGEATTPDGDQIYEYWYRWAPSGAPPRLHRQVYAIKDGRSYTFQATFTKRTKDTIGKQIGGMVESILRGDS